MAAIIHQVIILASKSYLNDGNVCSLSDNIKQCTIHCNPENPPFTLLETPHIAQQNYLNDDSHFPSGHKTSNVRSLVTRGKFHKVR